MKNQQKKNIFDRLKTEQFYLMFYVFITMDISEKYYSSKENLIKKSQVLVSLKGHDQFVNLIRT